MIYLLLPLIKPILHYKGSHLVIICITILYSIGELYESYWILKKFRDKFKTIVTL